MKGLSQQMRVITEHRNCLSPLLKAIIHKCVLVTEEPTKLTQVQADIYTTQQVRRASVLQETIQLKHNTST